MSAAADKDSHLLPIVPHPHFVLPKLFALLLLLLRWQEVHLSWRNCHVLLTWKLGAAAVAKPNTAEISVARKKLVLRP